MAASALPRVERLTLAQVRAVPDWHPEHASFEPFPVHAWLVWHRDGIVLVDTGIGIGNAAIDEWYRPRVTRLVDAMARVGVAARDVAAIVLSHLHFDHCGQQGAVSAPVYVQRAEHEAANAPMYTVAEWASIPDQRLRLVDGDTEILDGLVLLSTPGHTPGHQSVLVESAGERVVLAAQCAFRTAELRTGNPASTNLHDDTWADAARHSLARIRALAPATVHLSHDPETIVVGGRSR